MKDKNIQDFNTLLYIKVRGLVQTLITQKKMNFIQALHYVYESRIYTDFLCDEATKTWHCSTTRLLYYLEMEKEKNQFEFLSDEL